MRRWIDAFGIVRRRNFTTQRSRHTLREDHNPVTSKTRSGTFEAGSNRAGFKQCHATFTWSLELARTAQTSGRSRLLLSVCLWKERPWIACGSWNMKLAAMQAGAWLDAIDGKVQEGKGSCVDFFVVRRAWHAL